MQQWRSYLPTLVLVQVRGACDCIIIWMLILIMLSADSVPDMVYAGRICSQREKGEYCDTVCVYSATAYMALMHPPQATAFTQVYDATKRLTTKSAMPQISPVDIGKNDMEATDSGGKGEEVLGVL